MLAIKESGPVLDVRRFGRAYWISVAYMGVILVLTATSAHSATHQNRLLIFIILSTISQIGVRVGLCDIRAAWKSGDRNALWGNGLALILGGAANVILFLYCLRIL